MVQRPPNNIVIHRDNPNYSRKYEERYERMEETVHRLAREGRLLAPGGANIVVAPEVALVYRGRSRNSRPLSSHSAVGGECFMPGTSRRSACLNFSFLNPCVKTARVLARLKSFSPVTRT